LAVNTDLVKSVPHSYLPQGNGDRKTLRCFPAVSRHGLRQSKAPPKRGQCLTKEVAFESWHRAGRCASQRQSSADLSALDTCRRCSPSVMMPST
jgi:hypothetical protein